MYTMFRFLSLCLLAALVPAQNTNAPEESQIRQVIQQYLHARERRDPKAVAAVFTPDADQLVSSGEWRRGRDEVVRGTMASSRSTGGHRSITVESVRFLTRDVAIADGRYDLTELAGGATRRMWTTLVVKRTADGWRVAAIRNMLPAAPSPSR